MKTRVILIDFDGAEHAREMEFRWGLPDTVRVPTILGSGSLGHRDFRRVSAHDDLIVFREEPA